MQLTSTFCAVALLSTAVFAGREEVNIKNPAKRWFGHHHHHSRSKGLEASATTEAPVVNTTPTTSDSLPAFTSTDNSCPVPTTSTIFVTVSYQSTTYITVSTSNFESATSSFSNSTTSTSLPPQNSTFTLTTTATTSSSSPNTTSTIDLTSTLPSLAPTLSFSVTLLSTASQTTSLHPSTTLTPTTVITAGQATGTPDPHALFCGVHGFPSGNYFLSLWDYSRHDMFLTLEDCWGLCTWSAQYGQGCVAYEFYPEPVINTPRCALYGGSVADSLQSVISYVPNVWYDLGCGNPVQRAV